MAPQGSRRCSEYGEGDGVDRLSNLPKELLLLILGRLASRWGLRTAVRTSILSRRWLGLWTWLPDLVFDNVDPESVEAVLAQVTRPALSYLRISFEPSVSVPSQRVSSLLGAAVRLEPESLAVSVEVGTDKNHRIRLPCFGRTVSLSLDVLGVRLRPPRSGEFTMLESLSLYSHCMNPATLLPMCPCLRVLDIDDCWGLDVVIVHSASLEVLSVSTTNSDLRWVDIDGPVLKDMKVDIDTDEREFSVSFSAPVVKELDWVCCGVNIGFGIWNLQSISERKLHDSYVVSLQINCSDFLDAVHSFAQEMSQLPKPNFSILELELCTEVHVYGSLVLHLLRIRPAIQRLKIVLEGRNGRESCPPNCPCGHPNNWRSENVALTDLEEVEILGFKEKDYEVDFLKLLLRCATVLQRVNMKVSDKVSLSNNGYKKIYGIFEEYPRVECYIYSSCGKRVLYP